MLREFVKNAAPNSEDVNARSLFSVRGPLGSIVRCVSIYPEDLSFKNLELDYQVGQAQVEIQLGCHSGGDKAYVNRKRVHLRYQENSWSVSAVE